MMWWWSILAFFFNDTATTGIYTRSLHDALPICRHRARRAQRLQRQAGHAAAEHLQRARDALARPRAVGRVDLAPGGLEVEQDAEDLRARHAVDDRVVDLRQQRAVPVLEPVDEVELPQRSE